MRAADRRFAAASRRVAARSRGRWIAAAVVLALAGAGLASTAGSQMTRVNRRPPTIGKLYPGQLPSGAGLELATRSCLKCHSASMITQQRKDAAAWTKTLTQMTNWGVELTDPERERLRDYLVAHFGPRR